MKKYISILSLAAAIVLQACDRSELDSKSEGQLEKANKSSQRTTVYSRHSGEETNTSNMAKPDTGDDDEPRKDKSHWRLPVDTVKK